MMAPKFTNWHLLELLPLMGKQYLKPILKLNALALRQEKKTISHIVTIRNRSSVQSTQLHKRFSLTARL